MSQIKVELQEWMGSDRSIAEAAWTSSYTNEKKETRTNEDVERVINLLADSKHSVPFESVIFRFWIKLPIVSDRQHMTHRIASHSGMSGRYRTMPSEWLYPPDDVVQIVAKTHAIEKKRTNYFEEVLLEYEDLCRSANEWYRHAVLELKAAEDAGVIANSELKRVREFLRGVLPQNNMTERVTMMNLRSFANYQKLRNSDHAQPEIRFIAQQMLAQVVEKNICPIAIDALKRNGWII